MRATLPCLGRPGWCCGRPERSTRGLFTSFHLQPRSGSKWLFPGRRRPGHQGASFAWRFPWNIQRRAGLEEEGPSGALSSWGQLVPNWCLPRGWGPSHLVLRPLLSGELAHGRPQVKPLSPARLGGRAAVGGFWEVRVAQLGGAVVSGG